VVDTQLMQVLKMENNGDVASKRQLTCEPRVSRNKVDEMEALLCDKAEDLQ
jgi:hypothetical protein